MNGQPDMVRITWDRTATLLVPLGSADKAAALHMHDYMNGERRSRESASPDLVRSGQSLSALQGPSILHCACVLVFWAACSERQKPMRMHVAHCTPGRLLTLTGALLSALD